MADNKEIVNENMDVVQNDQNEALANGDQQIGGQQIGDQQNVEEDVEQQNGGQQIGDQENVEEDVEQQNGDQEVGDQQNNEQAMEVNENAENLDMANGGNANLDQAAAAVHQAGQFYVNMANQVRNMNPVLFARTRPYIEAAYRETLRMGIQHFSGMQLIQHANVQPVNDPEPVEGIEEVAPGANNQNNEENVDLASEVEDQSVD